MLTYYFLTLSLYLLQHRVQDRRGPKTLPE